MESSRKVLIEREKFEIEKIHLDLLLSLHQTVTTNRSDFYWTVLIQNSKLLDVPLLHPDCRRRAWDSRIPHRHSPRRGLPGGIRGDRRGVHGAPRQQTF